MIKIARVNAPPLPMGRGGNKKRRYCKTKCNLEIVRLTATIFMTAGCV